MNSKSKLAAIAIVAAVGVATPTLAFAQLQTGTAANREQLYGYGSSPSRFVPYYADRANGLGAYAEVPGSAFVNPGPARRPFPASGLLRRKRRI
jgi:hypothetical protein